MMTKRTILGLALFAVMLLFAPVAQAAPITLTFEAFSDLGVLTDTKTITDGLVGDANGVVGTPNGGVTAMGAFGQFNFFTTSGASVLQPGNLARLNLSIVNVSNSVSGKSGTLKITITNANLISSYGGQAQAVDTVAGSLTGAGTGISVQSWVTATSIPGGTLAVFNPTTGATGAGLFNFADSALFELAAGGNFSLATQAVIDFRGVGSATMTYADLKINPVASVPEPGSLLLFGSGMLGLATVIRRKRRIQN